MGDTKEGKKMKKVLIFSVPVKMTREAKAKLRVDIMRQIEEGILILDGGISLLGKVWLDDAPEFLFAGDKKIAIIPEGVWESDG